MRAQIEVVKNSSWGNQGRTKAKGMYEVKNSESLESKLEALLDKKLAQLDVEKPSKVLNIQASNFSCEIFGGTNHDTSYCGGVNLANVAALSDGNQNQAFDSQGGRGYHQNANQGRWNNQGYKNEPHKHPNARNQGPSNINQGPKGGQVPFPKEQAPTWNMDFQNPILSQLQNITQSNQALTQQISEMLAHLKVVDNQLAQLAKLSPQPLFPGNSQPNPINQTRSHTAKAIHLQSGSSYKNLRCQRKMSTTVKRKVRN